MPPIRFVIAIAAVLLGSPSRGLYSQPVKVQAIDGRPSCPGCSIVIEKAVRLSDPAAGIDGGSGNITFIDRDSKGRYWVADFGSRTGVLVFDGSGRFLRKIGREGSGPGEFRNVVVVRVGNGDTVHAFDHNLMRRSVIAPDQMKVVASNPWPNRNVSIIPLPNGNFLSSGVGGNASGLGQPMHEISPDGAPVASYGGDTGKYFRYMDRMLTRRLALDGSGGFYAVHGRSYIIERRKSSGALTGTWERKVDWFPRAVATSEVSTAESGLPPGVFAAWTDSTGLLYVYSRHRQADWRKAIAPAQSEGVRIGEVVDADKYWESVVEVFDLKSSRLVASKTFDKYFDGPAGKGLLYTKSDSPVDHLDIWRVRLVRP